MTASYLTDDERVGLFMAGPDGAASYVIAGVSRSILSLATYSRGAIINGHRYTYIPVTDELIRNDVLTAVRRARRKAANAARVQHTLDV